MILQELLTLQEINGLPTAKSKHAAEIVKLLQRCNRRPSADHRTSFEKHLGLWRQETAPAKVEETKVEPAPKATAKPKKKATRKTK